MLSTRSKRKVMDSAASTPQAVAVKPKPAKLTETVAVRLTKAEDKRLVYEFITSPFAKKSDFLRAKLLGKVAA